MIASEFRSAPTTTLVAPDRRPKACPWRGRGLRLRPTPGTTIAAAARTTALEATT